jgi:hypothetical protein
MLDFTNDEFALLYESVNSRLGRLFQSRLEQKSSGDWDEFEEELYWAEFQKYKPLWDKLHKYVKG